MRKALFILTVVLLFPFIKVFTQFKYNEYDEIIAFSYVYEKVAEMKQNNEIPTLILPSYNNDSLFWERNIDRMIKEIDHYMSPLVRASGIAIDTLIQFNKVSKRIRIKEGYIWLYRITSPTAWGLSVSIKFNKLDSGEYISAHSNWHDSINGMYDYHLPDICTKEEADNYGKFDSVNNEITYGFHFYGNNLYLERFSPKKSLGESSIEIFRLGYEWSTRPPLREAPYWIRERYPNVDFENYRKK